MAADVALIVTVVTKLAPKLYDKALEAFESKAMKPNPRQTELELIRFPGHLTEQVGSGSPEHGEAEKALHRRVQA